jgi:mono/diheme cytochrome c family protein
MAIYNRFIDRYRLLPLLLAFSFLVTACGQTAQPAATMTPAPTAAQPTATMTLPPTAAQPTPTMTLAPTAAPTSTPVIKSALDIELPEGDSERGLSRAIQFRCAGCHGRAYGPSFDAAEGLPSIMERGELRMADPAYEGSASTNREYIIESVLLPEVYAIPGNWPEPMPTDYGDLLTEQDLADIFAWMSSFE